MQPKEPELRFTKTEIDIPESHFYAFRVCNSAGYFIYKSNFYKLKTELLKKFGTPNDYDVQHIEKRCFTCNGTGKYSPGVGCRSCGGTGIYDRKKVALKRYILNGQVFHEPVGELIGNRVRVFIGYDSEWEQYPTFEHRPFEGFIKGEIMGIIKHEPYKLSPVWAYFYLLYFYDPHEFYLRLNNFVASFQTNTLHKLKELLRHNNPLKALAKFYEVSEHELGPINDLPY